MRKSSWLKQERVNMIRQMIRRLTGSMITAVSSYETNLVFAFTDRISVDIDWKTRRGRELWCKFERYFYDLGHGQGLSENCVFFFHACV